jgi:hypothetical protein
MSLANPAPYVADQIILAGQKLLLRQPPSEKFVAEPDPIRVHNVCLAIVGDVRNSASTIKRIDASPIDILWLPRESYSSAKLVQRYPTLRTERTQHVAKV